MSFIPKNALRELAGVNINLFVALAALLDAQSVTGAARAVGVTQSAMSQTLKQLRDFYDDPLLERSGNTMRLTPFAKRLIPHLGKSIHGLTTLANFPQDFDPRRDAVTFRLSASDQFALPIAAALTRRWGPLYPGVKLDITPSRSASGLTRSLIDRDIDLAISAAPGAADPMTTRTLLFEETFSCVMRRGHDLDRPEGFSLDDYTTAAHAIIGTADKGEGAIDTMLRELGRSRNVMVRMASFLGAPMLCITTDLLIACPTGLASFLAAQSSSLSVRPLPFPSPRFSVWLVVASRRDDGELQFLRDEVLRAARELPMAYDGREGVDS